MPTRYGWPPPGQARATGGGCLGWYWTTYADVGGKLVGDRGAVVLRCACGAEYDFLYVVVGRRPAEELKDGARCGSCYTRMFTTEEHEALLKLNPRVMDTEKEAAPLEALLQLLGYRRLTRRAGARGNS